MPPNKVGPAREFKGEMAYPSNPAPPWFCTPSLPCLPYFPFSIITGPVLFPVYCLSAGLNPFLKSKHLS
jgi:quinol-cytochrome oxidoreductase complex cytochrome b subunit